MMIEEQPEQILHWFAWEHLTKDLGDVCKPFGELAAIVVTSIPAGPERSICLRKLLEAKDAGMRAHLEAMRREGP